MASLIIGIGDCKLSSDPADVLVTHALGSCIAILIHDPVARVAGLLHYMLPESSLDLDRAARNPFLYADTGIPLLFQNAYDLGAIKSRMVVMAVGGAHMLDVNDTFHIGQRNHQAMRRIFHRAGVQVQKEEIGGKASRTVRIDVGSGRVQLRVSGEPECEMSASSRRKGFSHALQHPDWE
ncbi:chemotaxis protein CheD [Granulicella sibirica]|uniref:Probable chemoreceptor glutamine deamidase CheD n=1 Tax=Granulicella sibirica TaxID=2479048 RepID=A0A4Q0T8X9_9BACT|nr:chemotaxis protein CheD [Granulicella sibirica]RXH58628.1 Chemotaxis protein CheD [Granulicella sibirica]